MVDYAKQKPVAPPSVPVPVAIMLQAEPEPLEIDLQKTAVIVIDMQNAFVSKGGMFDLWGQDILRSQKVIQPIKKITSAARAKGLRVVYIAHEYYSDLREVGPNSPNSFKKGAVAAYYEHPEWRDKLLLRGTWGADIIEELRPQEEDIFVSKPRFSAFSGTNLDSILRTYNIKYLVFVGVTTNTCVEASIRDAYDLEYFSILITDAVMNNGPAFTQEATIFNVKRVYGWVTTTENIISAMLSHHDSQSVAK